MKKIFKWILIVVVVCLLLVVAGLVLLQKRPDLIVQVVNKKTPYLLAIEELQMGYLPLSVNAKGVVMGNKGQQPALVVKELHLQSSLKRLVKNQPMLSLDVKDSEVWVSRFTSSESEQSETSKDRNITSETLDLHELMMQLDLDIENVMVHLDEASTLNLRQVKSSKTDWQQNLAGQTKTVKADVNWRDGDSSLDVQVDVASKFVDQQSNLDIHIPNLDLSGLVSANQPDNAQSVNTPPINTKEAPIDWRWMKRISPLKVNLSVDTLRQAENIAEAVRANLDLDDTIHLSASAKADWQLAEGIDFKDALSVKAQLKPLKQVTKKEDVDLNVTLSSSSASVQLEGQANLNGQTGNQLALRARSTQLPISMNSSEKSFAHWFPLDLDANIGVEEIHQQAPVQTVAKKSATLELSALTMGDSDLQGKVAATYARDQSMAIDFDLRSNIFEIAPRKEAAQAKEQSRPQVSEVDSKQEGDDAVRVFSQQPLDWSWLHRIRVNGNLQANEIRANNTVLDKVVVPVVLDESGLHIDKLSMNIADGQLNSAITLMPNDGQVTMDANLQLQNMLLESLNLLPKEQLQGGKTHGAMTLSSAGASAYDLVSGLNGNVKIEVDKGVIGNDTFELIGSDLVLELLNKLNPFMASDPSTDLDCGVVNLRVEEGQVKIDKSIAIETSKMAIVADGKVDLENEKLDIEFSPKARQGVGLNVGSLVKFIKLGGRLDAPKPAVSAVGLLETGVAVGAAMSTGGASLLAEGLSGRVTAGSACERANKAFQ